MVKIIIFWGELKFKSLLLFRLFSRVIEDELIEKSLSLPKIANLFLNLALKKIAGRNFRIPQGSHCVLYFAA